MIDPKAVEELRTQIADAEEHDDPAVSITFGCARALLTALAERERLRAVAINLNAASSLVDALEKAAEQFEFYAREHREKAKASFFNGLATAAEASLEKAGTNQRMADSCRIALSHYRAGKEKADG
jgi:type III secretory pathway component EscR